ncbi:MAG: electron transport complex subunit RsxG [Pseudomonadota bacterium]
MTPVKASLRTALTMLAFAVIGTALLAYTFDLTRAPIANSEEEARLALMMQVVPQTAFDNDLLRDIITLAADPLLGTQGETIAYRARRNGKPAAVVLEAIAPDGYSGKIKLLVAIRADGAVSGVRVVAHKETPGLGDYIEVARSAWIRHFDGKTLASETDEGAWRVKKDGGQFDYMAGATITPRAVVKAVKKALQYYASHREQLFAPAISKENRP